MCGVKFNPPSAEDFAFNSMGACPKCHGTGICETINEKALIADENKTIREGTVISEGTVEDIINNKNSIIKGFLDGKENLLVRDNKSCHHI